MDHPNLPATDDLRILLVTENTLLASLLSGQFRDAGGAVRQYRGAGGD